MKLSLHCEFRDFLEEALRDKLVCGVRDTKTRKRLLVEKDLTLAKALEISKSLEGIDKETLMMDSSVRGDISITREPESVNRLKPGLRCNRCGAEDHFANKCRFEIHVCAVCRMVGHTDKARRNKGNLRRLMKPRESNDLPMTT